MATLSQPAPDDDYKIKVGPVADGWGYAIFKKGFPDCIQSHAGYDSAEEAGIFGNLWLAAFRPIFTNPNGA